MQVKGALAKAKQFVAYLWTLLLKLIHWKHTVEKEKEIDLGYYKKVAIFTFPVGLIILVLVLLLGGGTAVHLALREHYTVAQGVINELNLDGSDTKVVLALDGSGSMDWQYHNGTVQATANRVLALGLAFNGKKVPVYFFSDEARRAGEMNQENFLDFMEKHPPDFQGTQYAGVLRLIQQAKSGADPVLVLFITDGDNDDRGEASWQLEKMQGDGIYVQFVGLHFNPSRNSDIGHLQNVGIMEADNISTMTDPDLYRGVLTPYATWYHKAH